MPHSSAQIGTWQPHLGNFGGLPSFEESQRAEDWLPVVSACNGDVAVNRPREQLFTGRLSGRFSFVFGDSAQMP
jgi:hypothetical protein